MAACVRPGEMNNGFARTEKEAVPTWVVVCFAVLAVAFWLLVTMMDVKGANNKAEPSPVPVYPSVAPLPELEYYGMPPEVQALIDEITAGEEEPEPTENSDDEELS